MEIGDYYDATLQGLSWEWEVLAAIEQAAHHTGIEAWGSTGLFYRPFFNGRLGPIQRGFDKDVCVRSPADAQHLWAYLTRTYPAHRWSIFSGERENAAYGVPSPHWAIQMGRPLLFRVGAVRLEDGRVHVKMPALVEASLWAGVMDINSLALTQAQRRATLSAFYSSAAERARKTQLDYPQLRPGSTFGHLGAYSPVPLPAALATGERPAPRSAVPGAQGTTRVSGHPSLENGGLLAGATPAVFQPPAPASWPPELEQVRAIKAKQEVYFPLTAAETAVLTAVPPLPAHATSWGHHFFTQEADASFRDWLAMQVRSRSPLGGQDPLLRDFFSGFLFDPTEPVDTDAWRYDDWSWKMYARQKMFELDTDFLRAYGPDLVASLRLATLFLAVEAPHDAALLLPGRTGESVWVKHAPIWTNEAQRRITSWVLQGQRALLSLVEDAFPPPGDRVWEACIADEPLPPAPALQASLERLTSAGIAVATAAQMVLAGSRAHLAASPSRQFLTGQLTAICTSVWPAADWSLPARTSSVSH